MKRLLLCMICLLTLWQAGLSEPMRITLDEAIDRALDKNDALGSSRHVMDARRWGKIGALTNFLPRVSFSTAWSRVDRTTFENQKAQYDFLRQFAPDIPDVSRESYGSELVINQPIYNGGALIAGLSAATHSYSAARHSFRSEYLNTILETKRAFMGALRARDLYRIQSESMSLAEEYLESMRRKRNLGMVANVDVLRWELQVSQNRSGLLSAEGNRDLAYMSFKRAIAARPDEEFEMVSLEEQEVDRLIAEAAYLVMDGYADALQDWEREVLSSSPGLKSVEAYTSMQRSLYRQTWSLFQPSLNFNYVRQWETDDDIRLDGLRTWRMSVVLSFPLFSSFGDYSSFKEARATMKAAERSEDDFRRAIVIELTSTASRLRTVYQQLESARISRDLARENRRLVDNRFEQGLSDNLTLVDAQISQTAAEVGYVSAMYEFLIVHAELEKILGHSDH